MSSCKSPITLVAGAAIGDKRLVVLSAGGAIQATESANTALMGVADYAVPSGDPVAIRTLSEDGTLEMVASGAVSAGAVVYCDDAGKIQAVPTAAGTYTSVGTAMEAATADGDIIEVLTGISTGATTVSS